MRETSKDEIICIDCGKRVLKGYRRLAPRCRKCQHKYRRNKLKTEVKSQTK